MYLLDTNFLINLQKRQPEALRFLLDNSVDFADCTISVITRLEVLGFSGQSVQDKANMALLVQQFACYELTTHIQEKTIKIREQRKIKLPDAIILATALVKGKKLVTADQKLQSAYQQFSENLP